MPDKILTSETVIAVYGVKVDDLKYAELLGPLWILVISKIELVLIKRLWIKAFNFLQQNLRSLADLNVPLINSWCSLVNVCPYSVVNWLNQMKWLEVEKDITNWADEIKQAERIVYESYK